MHMSASNEESPNVTGGLDNLELATRNRPSIPCIRDDEGLTIEVSRFNRNAPAIAPGFSFTLALHSMHSWTKK